jgi:hypothetical protein
LSGFIFGGSDHCKLHGADVTSRLLAIIRQTGLVDASACPGKRHSQSVGLVSMVAAMVHDYGHPQINNACLIEEVSGGDIASFTSRSRHPCPN